MNEASMTTNHAEVIRECLSDGTVPICDALAALDALTREAEAMRTTAAEQSRVHVEMHNQITDLNGKLAQQTEAYSRLAAKHIADNGRLVGENTAQAERIKALEEAGHRVLANPGCGDPDCCSTAIDYEAARKNLRAALAPKEAQEPDLSKCPKCGGPADNGHDRCLPPSPYFCTRCQEQG